MSLPALYAHQVRAIGLARQAYREGARAILIASPTGSGKTRLAVEIARSAELRGRRVLWLAHRRELLEQARAQLDDAGGHGIRVHSVQALAVMAQAPDADLVVFDECHHFCGSPEWSAVARHYLHALRIGLTATPCRHDGAPMGELFDRLIVAATVRELTDLGLLVPCEVIAPAGKRDALADDPITAYLRFASGRRAIVFCSSVTGARQLAEAFSARGVPAACVDGKLPDQLRDSHLARFRRGELLVLTNVHILTEGTDLPEAEVCILARGVSHQGALLQCVGRVLRLAPWAGKVGALLLDLKGSVHQHGLPSDDREYSLTGKPITLADGLEALKQCRGCGAVFRWQPQCPRCGASSPRPVDPAVRRETLKAIRATEPQEKRRAVYIGFVRQARERGYKPAWAAMRFKGIYGYWPSFRASEASP